MTASLIARVSSSTENYLPDTAYSLKNQNQPIAALRGTLGLPVERDLHFEANLSRH
jgi:hypothetical protein